MNKFLINVILFVILLGVQNYAQAFDIVFPKVKNHTVFGDTTFFIGSSKTPLLINSESIKLHHTGAFAHFVRLQDGINTFVIKSDDKSDIYYVTKKIKPKYTSVSKTRLFNQKRYFVVTKDNTPLRSTPINAGINRLAHLQQGVLLSVDGQKGEFYRVRLDKENVAWISKNNVKLTNYFSPAKLSSYEYSETDEDYFLIFHLNKKIPFKITENDVEGTIGLEFYNTDKEHKFHFNYREKAASNAFWGYGGEYIFNSEKNSWDFVLKIRKPPIITRWSPLKDIVITVDAGHGGVERGAIGCLGDNEKAIVLKMAKFLEQELISRGAKVVMTRREDLQTGLYDRVEIANNNNSMFFVSIHNNALSENKNPNEHRGTSVYYYYNQAQDFAKTILDTMVQKLDTQNDGVHQASYAVVRNTNALSILVEVAYMINPDDNELLIDEKFQKKTAVAIANGIEKYLLHTIIDKKI